MGEIRKFDRCIYCFSLLQEEPGGGAKACADCGYEDGRCLPKANWLSPGTILKGRYMTGRLLRETETELVYLSFDLMRECIAEIHEYYPRQWLKRDITFSEQAYCMRQFAGAFELGKQRFFERARRYCKRLSRAGQSTMDFFVRNGTCYYVTEDVEEKAEKGNRNLEMISNNKKNVKTG